MSRIREIYEFFKKIGRRVVNPLRASATAGESQRGKPKGPQAQEWEKQVTEKLEKFGK